MRQRKFTINKYKKLPELTLILNPYSQHKSKCLSVKFKIIDAQPKKWYLSIISQGKTAQQKIWKLSIFEFDIISRAFVSDSRDSAENSKKEIET